MDERTGRARRHPRGDRESPGTGRGGSRAPVRETAARRSAAGERLIVGWREWVVLPELWPHPIKAKIDTGARSSAIHAFNIRVVRVGGRRLVRFDLHPVQRRREPQVSCELPFLDRRPVRSSNGRVERRVFVSTLLTIGGRSWPIELSLAGRDEMSFRLLLGREALRRRVLVDPGKSYMYGDGDSAGVLAAAALKKKERRTR